MRLVKNHLSVIFPIIVILVSLQFSISLEKVVKDYESRLLDDYSIIIVSSEPLTDNILKSTIGDFQSITLMPTSKILDKLKDDISSKNIIALQESLPKFYSLKLTHFPSNKRLEQIKRLLANIKSISRVEAFSKTHDKIYKMFVIANSTTFAFTILVLCISLLLILKQMRIWVYEHKDRMDIMTLFGAPFWMKSAALYKLVIYDAIFSSILVTAFFYVLPSIKSVGVAFENLGILLPQINIIKEGGFLLLIALLVSLFSVSLVMLRIKKG